MKLRSDSLIFLLFLAIPLVSRAAPDGLQEWSVRVDGVERTALISAPATAKATAAPVVFVYHGHGGSSAQAARGFALQREWREAIVVYPQGLDTPGILTDRLGLRAGWQSAVGDQQDRDLKFFDMLLGQLKSEYQVDSKRIYSTGHSNGGGFTYLLWLTRPKVLAAVAPSSAAARYVAQLTPKPAMILGGRADRLVKFEWQERMIDAVKKINGCTAAGEPWADRSIVYQSKGGTPLVTFIHDGGHMLDPVEPALIASFFKQQGR